MVPVAPTLLCLVGAVGLELASAENIPYDQKDLLGTVRRIVEDETRASVRVEGAPEASCQNDTECIEKLAASSEDLLLSLRAIGGPTRIQLSIDIYSRTEDKKSRTLLLDKAARETWKEELQRELAPLLVTRPALTTPKAISEVPEPHRSSGPMWLLGSGGVATAVGLGFSLSYASSRSTLLDGDYTAPEHGDLVSNANLSATVATVSLAVGGALLASGAAWFFLAE